MENASKALLIAGAILLAILIISLGIGIFIQAQDTIGNSGMSKAEIQSFNSQFTKYEGTRKGSEVKALIQEVNASNASDNAEGNGRSIEITVDSKTKDYTVASSAQYNVKCAVDSNTGYINKITVEKITKKTE